MNRFFTLLLAASCLTAFGQTEYPYPYNPDGNNDGYISLNDLLDLLSVYGSEFNAGILATDSISAVYYTGELDYYDCASSCVALRGNWKMLDKDLVGSYKASISNQTYSAWLDVRNAPMTYYGSSALSPAVVTSNWATGGFQTNDLKGCFCQTRTRADIEDINVCEGLEDECGVCNGEGAIYECGCSDIPEGDCDCEGNQLDAIGVCGGDCLEDADGDGVCDPVMGPCEGQDYVTYHGYDYEIVETADGRCWFGEYLRSESFNDGTLLSSDYYDLGVPDGLDINPPCYTIIATGHIYNGSTIRYTAGGSQMAKNICPVGWHVPSRLEWQELVSSYSDNRGSYVSMWSDETTSQNLLLWESLGTSGLNLKATGFDEQYNSGPDYNGRARYWTSTTAYDPATTLYITYLGSTSNWYQPNWVQYERGNEGLPIRCIKDAE